MSEESIVVEAKTIGKPFKEKEELRAWLAEHLHLKFPDKPACPNHVSPFEYIRRAYFEPGSDLVVWAPRGGGKTRLGAAATLLDLMHKPGVAVRILGGSLEQSMKMWDHLIPDVMEFARDHLSGKLGPRSVRLAGGSAAGVLTQSQRAVRGLRVQKLRCDEVEMFDADVWEAAQLATRTIPSVNPDFFPQYTGVVEAFSTVHEVGGLMERIVDDARAKGTAVLQWCLFEILEKCPEERVCEVCPLHEDCGGRAKEDCDGFFRISDAIAMKRRVSKETWEAEMLCLRPSRRGCVFGNFKQEIHVVEELPAPDGDFSEDPKHEGLYLGIDFGYRNPFVCLWVLRDRLGRSFVVDEYVQSEVEVDRHIEEILGRRQYGIVRRVGCDPAGSAPNEQTGISNLNKLRRAGLKVSCRGSRIVDGLEMIRAGLRSGTDRVSLFIHPRCVRLMKAMRGYHYGEGRAETPAKDGEHDHLIDALRYYFLNRDHGEVEGGRY